MVYTLYCEKEGNDNYSHFFGSKIQVRMCGASDSDIVQVNIWETQENEEHSHFGYYDINDDEIRFIFKNELAVKMCSPDYFRSAISEGRGRIIKITLEEF
jgi:hypothetical protein